VFAFGFVKGKQCARYEIGNNKEFVPCGKMSGSDVFLDAEFKFVSTISPSPTPFAPG
jgi:hypothetical protein